MRPSSNDRAAATDVIFQLSFGRLSALYRRPKPNTLARGFFDAPSAPGDIHLNVHRSRLVPSH